MTADWHEQAYEDQYWAERVAVSTWDKTTAAMFLDAVAMSTAPRAEAKAEVCADLLTQ